MKCSCGMKDESVHQVCYRLIICESLSRELKKFVSMNIIVRINDIINFYYLLYNDYVRVT